MKVFVYWNLRKKTWSVRALDGPDKGRVIFHSAHVLLSDAQGKVSQAGRLRVIRERRKNVHAGLVGHLAGLSRHENFTGLKINYNPYKHEGYVFADDETPYKGSSWAFLDTGKVLVAT